MESRKVINIPITYQSTLECRRIGTWSHIVSTYTADIPNDEKSFTALFADDIVVAVRNTSYEKATESPQISLKQISKWAKQWKIAINEDKSTCVDFTLRNHSYIHSYLDGKPVPLTGSAGYLGLHLDSKLNWAEHIRQKRDYLKLILRKHYWLIGRKSTLSPQSKRAIYTTITKPSWVYGIQLWGTSKPSNHKIIQVFQNKLLRTIANAPWYISNDQLHTDLKIRTVNKEYEKITSNYIARLHQHQN